MLPPLVGVLQLISSFVFDRYSKEEILINVVISFVSREPKIKNNDFVKKGSRSDALMNQFLSNLM